MYPVGIVGCGVIGERLAETFAAHDATEITAVCDLDAARADAFAETYDATSYTDHRVLLEESDVEIIYVGVPPKSHVEVAGDALDAGKHVVCEKPIAETADAGRDLVAAADSTDCVTAVNLPFRYTPGFVDLRERVERGDVGRLRRFSLDFRFPQWPRAWQDVDWLEGRDQGGPIREVGTHFLFGVQELTGGVDRLSAAVEYAGPGECEESVVGYFTADGVPGTIDLLTGTTASETNTLTVEGDDGALALTDWYRLVADPGPDERVLNEEQASTTAMLVDEFVAELEREDGDLVSFAEALRVQEVVDAIFASDGEPQRPRDH